MRALFLVLASCDRPEPSDTATSGGPTSGAPTTGVCLLRVTTSDSGADGTIDLLTRLYYSPNNDLVRNTFDFDVDGVLDIIRTQTWDSEHHLLEEREDEDADGVLDDRDVYTYDAAGRLLTFVSYRDDTDDLDYRRTNTWSDDGDLLREVVEMQWVDGAPVTVEVTDLSYDDQGRIALVTVEADTSTEAVYTYDASSRLVQIETRDFVGTLVALETWTYGEGDLPVTHDTQEFDELGATTSHAHIESRYDDQGRMVYAERDMGYDGILDTIWTWQYDDRGNLVEEQVDNDADGVPNVWNHRTFDERDHEVLLEVDRDEDGEWDSRMASTWDCSAAP